MNLCYFSLVSIGVLLSALYIFKKPSKEEINKFENEDQERFNWSKMGF